MKSNLPDKDFNIMLIHERMDYMRTSISRQEILKNTVTKIKNTLEGFKSRLVDAEEQIKIQKARVVETDPS